MEQKKGLSESINKLPPEKLGEVVQIIQESMPLETGQEEIELDIDSFDPTTLYRLYRIVVDNKSDIPLSKRRKIQKSYSKQKNKQNNKKSEANIDGDESSSSLSDSDTDSDDTGDNLKQKVKIVDIPMKTEEPEQIEDKEENQETKRGSKKASEHLKEDNHESSIKEIKEEYKSSNKSNTSIIKNQQKSANENETATLNKSNIGNKSKSINEISNSQSKLEEASKIEDISEYIDNYVAAAKNDKKQKELENSHRERSHDWRRNRINERHSWSEKDLKVTPEMEEKRKKYLESLDQPVVII